MKQDAYYLKEFARALAFIAARASSQSLILQFLQFSEGALMAERELHAKFTRMDEASIELTPASLGYTSYLIQMASVASLEEAISAVLPCFWVYKEVGREIAKRSCPKNAYFLWIETYSSESFAKGVYNAIAIFDQFADEASDSLKGRMLKAFRLSTLYEWHFWNDAYQQRLFSSTKNLFLIKSPI